MAASKKTAVLGLSLWQGTDKPRRADFVADNEALEAKLGGQIGDAAVHLDTARAQKLDTPFAVQTYAGNGSARHTELFDFEPSLAVVFAVNKGASEWNGTCTKHYAGVAEKGGSASAGVALNAIGVTMLQEQTVPASGGAMPALNEKGVTYCVLAFR